MDEKALNYNKEATIDSGKCKFELADETPVKQKHKVNNETSIYFNSTKHFINNKTMENEGSLSMDKDGKAVFSLTDGLVRFHVEKS